MLRMDKKSEERIAKAFAMEDSNEKLRVITNLELEAEEHTPLHQRLLDEGNRLLAAGYFWID